MALAVAATTMVALAVVADATIRNAPFVTATGSAPCVPAVASIATKECMDNLAASWIVRNAMVVDAASLAMGRVGFRSLYLLVYDGSEITFGYRAVGFYFCGRQQ